jgi:hypothetical protein
MGGTAGSISRRGLGLSAAAAQYLVKRHRDLLAWTGHLPWPLRSMERCVAGRQDRRTHRLGPARPADKQFDVAYALEYVTPFRDDEECVRWLQYPEPPDRRHRIEVFCDAYGIAVPEDVIGQVVHQQRMVMQTCEALARRGIEPQFSWISDGHLEKLQAQIRWTESLTP